MSELEKYKEIMLSDGNLPESTTWLEANGFSKPEFIARCLHI
jgi:hypothetical protein